MRVIGRIFLWLFELALGLACIAAVILAILPWILSMNGARNFIFSFLPSTSGKHVEMEKAEFNWFGPQLIQGLCIQDPARHASLSVPEIATNATLWQIFIGRNHDIGNLRISSPYLRIEAETPLPTVSAVALLHAGPNLSSLGGLCAGEEFARHFTGEVSLQEGTIEIAGPRIETVMFKNIMADAVRKPGDNLVFHMQGDSSLNSENGEILGNFHIKGTLASCKDTNKSLAITGTFTHLPVLGLDQIIALAKPELRGLFVTALGNTMDLTFSAVLGSDKGEAALDLTSPQAKIKIAMALQGDKLILRAPGTGSFTLTRALTSRLFSPVPVIRNLGMASSSNVQLNIEALEIPLTEKGLQTKDMSGRASLHIANLKLKTPALTKPIELAEIHTKIQTGKLDRDLLIDTTMNLQYGEIPSSLAATAQVLSPLNRPSLDTMALSADKFPVAFFDHLLLKNGQFAQAIGQTLDVRFALQPNEKAKIATLYVSSPQIAVDGVVMALKPHLQLMKPFQVALKPSSDWLKNHLPDVASSPITIAVKDFSIGDSLSTMAASINAEAEQISIEAYALSHPRLNLRMNSFDDIDLAMQAEGISSKINFRYDPTENSIVAKEVSRIKAALEPSSWAPFAAHFGRDLKLLRPAVTEIELQPFALSLDRPLHKLALSGNFQLADFALTNSEKPNSRFVLKDTSFTFRLDREKNEFSARGAGKVTGASDAWTNFQLESLIRNIEDPKPDIVCKFAAPALDTSALDPWLNISHSLAPLLGSPLNLKTEVMQKPVSSSFVINAKSNRLQLECGLAKTEDKLVLRNSRQPIVVNWTVMPEGFDAGADLLKGLYREEIPFKLAKACPISIRIDALSLPLSQPFSSQSMIAGRLSIERLPLIEKNSEEPLTFEHIELQFKRQNMKNPLEFQLQTAVEAAKPGLASIKGSIAENDLLRMNIEANFQNVPTILPDIAATVAGLSPHTISTIFGPALTGSFTTNIDSSSGPLSLQINTPSTRLSLKGFLNKGVLTLQESLFAEVTMTEEFSRRLLEKTNPLSVDIVTSEGPMTLTVDKEGFSFPIFPFNLAAAVIPHARIDLGRITCHNKGNLTDILTLLKQGQFSRQKDLKLWFAPMDFSMRGGVIDCERTEILVADHFDVATWGKIDLNKSRVNATLGLTSQALESAFGIKNLPPDYMLQLPLKGKIGDVKIDFKKATAKIALLLAAQQGSSTGGMLGGSKGAAIGGLLGQLSKLPDYGKTVPPAKHPFPWESESTSPAPKKKKKALFKPGEKPIKQLTKLFR